MKKAAIMLELVEKPRIWRLVDTHSYTSIEYSGEKVYFAETFATINTAGNRVYFASNWDNPAPDYSDVYVAKLPEGWPRLMH